MYRYFRPGNWQWEALFDNIDDAKVILTVRGKEKVIIRNITSFVENEEKWVASWKNFCAAQVNKNGIWGGGIAQSLMRLGLLGSLQMNFDKLSMLHTVFKYYSSIITACCYQK